MISACFIAKAQTPFLQVKQDGFGFNIGFIDFTFPAKIDTTSLSSVFKNSDIIHIFEKSPTISLSYWKGLINTLISPEDWVAYLINIFLKLQVYIMLQSQYRMTLSSNIIPNNLYHSPGVIANVGKSYVAPVVEMPASPAPAAPMP